MDLILVLVVDDDGGVRQAMADVLSDEGYEVRVAENGQRALEQLDAQVPALLVTDLEMPEVGGERLIAQARERHPQLPILVLTSRLVLDAHREAERLGVLGYLNKPIDIDVLLDQVKGALVAARRSSPLADRAAAAR
jgi:DNA-binding NtrC family response regulator